MRYESLLTSGHLTQSMVVHLQEKGELVLEVIINASNVQQLIAMMPEFHSHGLIQMELCPALQ
jgi:hypothetical protein